MLTLIDNQVDTTTGTILLKGVFPNESETLWPGEFVATTVRLFIEKNALVVPAQAVVMGQQGTYVYLVECIGHRAAAASRRRADLDQHRRDFLGARRG